MEGFVAVLVSCKLVSQDHDKGRHNHAYSILRDQPRLR
jgi:hypothetical protein